MERMAGGRAVVMPMLALLFGAAAVGLSMLASAERIKSHEVERTPKGCSYPRSPSFALGILAALALLIEQLIISVGIRCFCCGRTKCPTNCYGLISVIVYVLSWLSFVIAFIGLIDTAIDNSHHHLAKKCKTGRDDLFQGAAIWCVFTIVLSLISYAFFKAGVRRNRSNQSGDSLANEQSNVATAETTMQERS